MAQSNFSIGDRVQFHTKCGDEIVGTVNRINKKTLTIESSISVWRVSPDLVRSASEKPLADRASKPPRVDPQLQTLLKQFHVDDLVGFKDRGNFSHIGTVSRVNSKNVSVRAEDGASWTVPPQNLYHIDEVEAMRKLNRLDQLELAALTLLEKHGLSDWHFRFDQAQSRAGVCKAADCLISVSSEFALKAPYEEFSDTVLHEIAHALVGVRYGHGEVWRAKCREIGCSGARTHDITFSQPRWRGTCADSCDVIHQRIRLLRRYRRASLCTKCGEPIKWHKVG